MGNREFHTETPCMAVPYTTVQLEAISAPALTDCLSIAISPYLPKSPFMIHCLPALTVLHHSLCTLECNEIVNPFCGSPAPGALSHSNVRK